MQGGVGVCCSPSTVLPSSNKSGLSALHLPKPLLFPRRTARDGVRRSIGCAAKKKPRKGQSLPAAVGELLSKPSQASKPSGGTGVQERIAGLQQNGGARDRGGRSFERTTTLPMGSRSRSPDAEGVQVAEMSKAAIVRELNRRLQDLQDAKTEAEARKDDEEVARLQQAINETSALLGSAAAEAEMVVKAARKASETQQQLRELERLKAENEALQKLVLEVAPDKSKAADQVNQLKERCKQLVSSVDLEEVEVVLPPSLDLEQHEVDSEEQRMLILRMLAVQASLKEAEEAAAHKKESDEHPIESVSTEDGALVAAEPAVEEQQTSLEEVLVRSAEAATAAGSRTFIYPQQGLTPGVPGELFYNVSGGPLSQGARPRLKAGLNKWEDVLLLDCSQAEALQKLPNQNWWVVELNLPEDTFMVEYVIEDCNSGSVDNNGGRDFALLLHDAPSKEEVLLERARLVTEFERRRIEMLEEAEAAQWEEEMRAAQEEAAAARVAFRQQREAQLRERAAADAAARLTPPADAAKCEDSRQGVFCWLSAERWEILEGNAATLFFNAAAGPLRGALDLTLQVGRDGWRDGLVTAVPMRRLTDEEVESCQFPQGEWFVAEVTPEPGTAIVDFVLSGSFPNNEQKWDNNNKRDYHTLVKSTLDPAMLQEMLYSQYFAEEDESIREGEERTSKLVMQKAAFRAQALRRRRERQRAALYTIPVRPVAGQEVAVFYNSEATSLRGRPQAWLRGSWNRWTHPECFLPQLLQPVVKGAPGFASASVAAPSDAWMMDLVFSDTGDMHGGFYDNNGGLDYHIPVLGGSLPLRPLNITHVSVEMAPIAKVGGMGDVVTALARAVQEEGHNVNVILPKFDVINYGEVRDLRETKSFFHSNVMVRVWEGVVEELHTIFLEPTNGSFWVGCIYGRNDDASRFNFFCNIAMDYMRHHMSHRPDVVHCHDWPTAPVAFGDIGQAKAVFTIHNLNYGQDLIGRAMGASRVATTVSPSYAEEVSGHPAVAPSLGKFFGIRNGIDMDIWDPSQDRFLPRRYSVEDAVEGKAVCKEHLRREFNLSNADVPLVAVVTRLTPQKGIHLIKHAAWRTLERGGQFVLLGSAPDPRVQGEFNNLKNELGRIYPDRACLYFSFNEPLSHVVYAAADILVVPSMFEPCGLTQMIGMRYGAVPVVRKTGGLKDTVFDVDHDAERAAAVGYEPNGFNFDGTDQGALDYALNRALSTWYTDRGFWESLLKRGMQQDWSWVSPALDYLELYYKAIKS